MNKASQFLVILTGLCAPLAWAQPQSGEATAANEPVKTAQDVGVQAKPSDEDEPSLLATLSHNSDFEQTAALYALLADAELRDLERYVSEAKSIVSQSDRAAGLQIIYLRYLDLDPEGAIEHMLAAGTGLENQLVGALYFSWSKFDLDRAVRHSLTLPLAQHRQIAARVIVRANMHLDLDQLNKLANTLGAMAAQELAGAQAEIIARIAVDDPQEAMQRLTNLAQANRAEIAQHVMHHWAAADAEGLLKFVLSGDSDSSGANIRKAAMHSLAQQVPERLLQEIDQIVPAGTERTMAIMNAIAVIGRSNPTRALTLVRQIDNPRERRSALQQLVTSLSYQDPELAIAVLDELDDPALVGSAAMQAVPMLARQDLNKAIELAHKYQDQAPRMMQQLASVIAQTQPKLAVELAMDLAKTDSNPELRIQLISSLANHDPVSAAALAEDLPPSMQKLSALQQIGNAWFNLDPDAAIAWTLTQAPRASAEILQRLSHNAAQSNPQYAMGVVPLLPSAQVQNQWIGAIVHELSRIGSGREAVAWIEQFSDRTLHVQWVTQIAQSAAIKSIDDALDIAESISDEASYETAINSIVESWSARDVDAAASWVSHLKDAEVQGAWISSVAGHLSRRDVDQAIQWVGGFRQSAERDPAYANILSSGYVTSIQADTLLRKIMSPELRFNALRSYLQGVARYDEQEATRFLNRQTLDMEQKQALIDLIEGREATDPRAGRVIID